MPRDETCSAAKPALLVLGVVRVGGKQQSTAACWVWAVREGHCCSVCPFGRKAHLAQCNRAGGQADEAPLPAVGVLGQGELLRQGLDHMLDLHGVVLGHELPDQPGERGERGCRPVESSLPPPPCWLLAPGSGVWQGDDLFRKRNQESCISGWASPRSAVNWKVRAGSRFVSLFWVTVSLVHDIMWNSRAASLLGIRENARECLVGNQKLQCDQLVNHL